MMDGDHHKPTARIKWLNLDEVKNEYPNFNEEPRARRHSYGMTSEYVLRQLWVSDVEGEEPEWRPVEYE